MNAVRRSWFVVLGCALLSSCVLYRHEAMSRAGNTEKDTLISFGGTSSQKGADGSSFVHDHQATAQQFFQFLGAFTAAYLAADVQKVQELTTQMAAAGATRVQIANIQAKAAADATAAGADLTKFGITGGLFKPAATQFIQPKP